jgi:hypothetical protein
MVGGIIPESWAASSRNPQIYWLWTEWIDYINPQPDLEGRRREHGRRAH